MNSTEPFHDDELARALREMFRDEMRAAPAVPRRLVAEFREPSSPGRGRLGAWCGVLAAAATIVLALILFEKTGAAADPRAALEQAARAYLALDDATLRVDVRLQAIELLSALLSDDHEAELTSATLAWIRIAAPNRLLLWDDATSLADLARKPPAAGFDGLRMWSYDRAANVASVAKASADASGFDWMRVLSFDFVRELVEKPGEYKLAECTNATEERAGLRVFALEPDSSFPESGRIAIGHETIAYGKKPSAADDSTFWTEARITIDADAGAVERIEARFKLGPIPLAEATIEVVSSNDGFDAKDFAVDACVPKGAAIEEVDGADLPLKFGGASMKVSTKRVADAADSANARRRETHAVPDSQGDPVSYVEAITGLTFDVAQSKARRAISSGAASIGLLVAAVRADSPAAAAGIEPGDVVTKWNGEPIIQVADLALWIDDDPPRADAKINFSRLRKDVTLFSRNPWADFEAKLSYVK